MLQKVICILFTAAITTIISCGGLPAPVTCQPGRWRLHSWTWFWILDTTRIWCKWQREEIRAICWNVSIGYICCRMIRGSSIIECVCEPEVVIKRVYYTPVLRIAREMNFKKENQIRVYIWCPRSTLILSIMMLIHYRII